MEKRIDELLKENDRLKNENQSLRNYVSSRRFVFANKVANGFNELLPVGSIRRKCLKGCLFPLRFLRTSRNKKKIALVKKTIKRYKSVIVISGVAWNTPLPQRSHHLALSLAKTQDTLVIYYEPDGAWRGLRHVEQNLFTTNSLNLLANILDDERRYVFMFSNVLNISFSDIMALKDVGYELAYECIDELDESLSGGASINQREVFKKLPELGIDYAFSSADRLTAQLQKILPNKKIISLKNAVCISEFDYHLFEGNSIPFDLRNIIALKKPIVGYYGAISPWLNYHLIHKIAKKHPEISFVFIGVDYEGALAKLDQSIENIYYLGPKKQRELANYSVHFSCAIIPFLFGEIAKSTSPIKLFEYMATGLSTVCTRDLVECNGYEYVYVSKDDNKFEKDMLHSIKLGEDEKVRGRLLEQAMENTWEKRAELLAKTLRL